MLEKLRWVTITFPEVSDANNRPNKKGFIMKDYSFARLKTLAGEIGQLLQLKNTQYGDSFSKAPEILSILYPDGVTPYQYQDLLTIVRILDKINRISTGKADSEDPYKDIAGYSILAQVIAEEKAKEKKDIVKSCLAAEKRYYEETKAEIKVSE